MVSHRRANTRAVPMKAKLSTTSTPTCGHSSASAASLQNTFEPPSDLERAERVKVKLKGRPGEVHYERKKVGGDV